MNQVPYINLVGLAWYLNVLTQQQVKSLLMFYAWQYTISASTEKVKLELKR